MSKVPKSDILKKALLEALESSLGIVTKACRVVECSRKTFYQYCRDDPEFDEAVKEVGNVALDFAESKLFEKIEGVTVSKGKDEQGEEIIYKTPPSDTAIIFYLKTKGKKRGYIEKFETDIKIDTGEPTSIGFKRTDDRTE